MTTQAQTKAVVEYKPLGQEMAIKLTPQIVTNNLCVPTRSGKLPTPAEVINFMMLCRSRSLNPFEGDAFLVGYDAKDGPKFSLITGIQAFLKRSESCPEYDGHRAGIVVMAGGKMQEIEGSLAPAKAELLGGWAEVYRSDRKVPIKSTVDISVYNTSRSRWSIDPKGMIRKVALSQALREAFPTRLGGMNSQEEMDRQPEIAAPAPEPARENAGAPVTKLFRRADKPEVQDVGDFHRDPEPEPEPEPETVIEVDTVEEPKPEPRKRAPRKNWGVELAKIVGGVGHTFEEWCSWARTAGLFEADAIPVGWSAVPGAIAGPLVEDPKPMLDALADGDDLKMT